MSFTPSKDNSKSPSDKKKLRDPLLSNDKIVKLTKTPSSDLPKLLKRASRSSSSRLFDVGIKPKLEKLPKLSTASPDHLEDLIIKKIRQCRVIFDYSNPDSDLEQKEIKQDTLIELVDYINNNRGFLTSSIYREIIDMCAINLFRPIPVRFNPPGVEYDPEEDEPILEESWPHLQIVYELLLKFIESPEFNATVAKQFITQSFVREIINLFKVEDPREREYLKTILHRLYGKFLTYRSYIRKSIKYIFITYSYEDDQPHGIAELLEILGSIVNGFTLPLKDEHTEFLMDALLPLHIPKHLSVYHAHLTYCIVQYLEKDSSLAYFVIKRLLKYWPAVNSSKELLFLSELEEIISSLDEEAFEKTWEMIFKQYSKCMKSPHFQVAERALSLWKSDQVFQILIYYFNKIFPVIFDSLYEISQSHWHEAIKPIAWYSLKIYKDINEEVFYETVELYKKKYEEYVQRKEPNLNDNDESNEILKIVNECNRIRTEKKKYYPISREIIDEMIECVNNWHAHNQEEDDEDDEENTDSEGDDISDSSDSLSD